MNEIDEGQSSESRHYPSIFFPGAMVLYIVYKSPLPIWTLPLVGVVLAVITARILKRKFFPRQLKSMVLELGCKSLFLAIPILMFAVLAFLVKYALGLGPPTTRELAVWGSGLVWVSCLALFRQSGTGRRVQPEPPTPKP